jgi:2-polyprenyl-3-methyl-5-hydroxy-6-metoxy-1,4-benzoquinol methylase
VRAPGRSVADWRFEDRGCPICGVGLWAARELGRRGGDAHHLNIGIKTRVVRCMACHGVHQRPTALPLHNPYLNHSVEDYFRHHESASMESGQHLARMAEQMLGSRGRMLEVGCGRGHLLRGAAESGWQVFGIEMTAPFAAIARSQHGIDVEVSPVESAKALKQEWDVIVLAAVLEHLYEPGLVLRRISTALRKGGLVFVDVPNECSLYNYVGNLYLWLRGRDWVTNLSPTFPPFHVVGFCPRSLRVALTAAALTPISLIQYRTQTCVAGPRPDFWTRLERAGMETALTAGRLMGMGAGLICWARKS